MNALSSCRALVLALVASWAGAPALAQPPLVVELFTSQGCNSCPPADTHLADLARRDGVLALSFHVTYWDRLGWPDSFGLAAADERQRTYARRLGLRGLYTPQMVIGGRLDVVGSDRRRVAQALDLLAGHEPDGPPLEFGADGVRVGAGAGAPATVLALAFDERHEVAIGRGENRGRTLRYHNVVRDLVALGEWHGRAATFAVPAARWRAAGRSGVAILVQRDSDGAILAAAAFGVDGSAVSRPR